MRFHGKTASPDRRLERIFQSQSARDYPFAAEPASLAQEAANSILTRNPVADDRFDGWGRSTHGIPDSLRPQNRSRKTAFRIRFDPLPDNPRLVNVTRYLSRAEAATRKTPELIPDGRNRPEKIPSDSRLPITGVSENHRLTLGRIQVF